MVIIMTGTVIHAQTKKNALKTDPISPFFGVVVFKYERAFSENISFQLGSYYSWDFQYMMMRLTLSPDSV